MLNNAAHFIFDSDHVGDIEPRLYGFFATEAGIFTSADAADGDISNATGPWVYVQSTRAAIEISQDSTGCFGLFLFREGSYWALSNSFNHLLDFVKLKHRITLNTDYVCAYLVQRLCVDVYGETIIREISWLDRRARIMIDPGTAELRIQLRRLEEHTLPADTEEGLRLIDAWHDKWKSFVESAARSWHGTIKIDVTGGFDTRMLLAPVLSARTDMGLVCFNSNPIHEEDFRIASQLSEEFGFPLNKAPSASSNVVPIETYAERSLEPILFEKKILTKPSPHGMIPCIYFRGFGG